MENQKEKPKIKKYIIRSAITYFILIVGYLFFCIIQGLIKHGELGHFYLFAKRGHTTEITDTPILIICYFTFLLLMCLIPNLIMFVKEIKEYKSVQKCSKGNIEK